MKKHIAIILTIIFSFVSIFSFPVPVKADLVGGNVYQVKKILQDWNDGKNKDAATLLKFINNLQSIGGFIVNPVNQLSNLQDFIDTLDGASSGSHSITGYPAQGSDQEKIDFMIPYMQDNVNIDNSNNNISINDNSRNIIDSFNNYYINNNGYFYIYSFNLVDAINTVPSGTYYNTVRKFLIEHQDNYYCFLTGNLAYNPSSSTEFWLLPKNPDIVGLRYSKSGNIVGSYNYSQTNWIPVGNYLKFKYDTNTLSFNYIENANIGNYMYSQYDTSNRSIMNQPGWLTVGRYDTNICYMTLNDLKRYSLGEKPYYLNNSVYNDFSSTTGDFTFDSSNSNNTTFGDIESYINSFNNEHGDYPTQSDIQIFIENYVPESNNQSGGNNTVSSGSASASATANATSSGGNASANNEGINITINNNHSINFPTLSGNNPTVSGNGSGGNGSIFDWISSIGGVIGDFIKNVGDLLADVIRGISEAITTILATVPNLLTNIVNFVYGGLPDELKALVTMGITCVVFVSVIKILRK